VSDDPKYRDEDWLREQYVEERRTTADIAKECGCSPATISNWLSRNSIETRGAGGPTAADKRLTDEAWLREQYVQKGRTRSDIAEECECSRGTVSNWLRRNDIRVRRFQPSVEKKLRCKEWMSEQYVSNRNSTLEIADKLNCSPGTVNRYLREHGIEVRSQQESKRPSKDSPLLDKGYLAEKCGSWGGVSEVADECGVEPNVVRYWLSIHGVESPIEQAGIPEGESHPRWDGGPQSYGPGWNASKRRAVRERDDHTCQDPTCSVTQDDHLAQYDQKLHVHHLIKARDVDDPEVRNAPENLVTLCRDCHQRWERMAEAGIRPQIDGVTAD